MAKLDKVKKHLSDNKAIYISAGIGLGVGIITTALLLPRVNVSQVAIGKDITQLQITEVHLARRGHPGNVIKCNETGELFASQGRAATLLGLSKSNISKHLNGLQPNVDGMTFTKVGEARA